jgi:hypothetical protein
MERSALRYQRDSQDEKEIEMPGETPVATRAGGSRAGAFVPDAEEGANGDEEEGYQFGRLRFGPQANQSRRQRKAGSPAVGTDDVDVERMGTILMPHPDQPTARPRALRVGDQKEPKTNPPVRNAQAAATPRQQQGRFRQAIRRIWQRRTWKGKVALVVCAALLAYILAAMVYDAGWQAVRHWQYGTFPTDQVSVVTGQGDSQLAPTQIQAASMNGQIQITIVPAGNLKNTVILAGPIVSWDNPIITLTPEVTGGVQSKIEVQILTPPNLLSWNPAPITCYILATSKGYTLVRA